MLLPIVLLLASAGPIQQAENVPAPNPQTSEARTLLTPAAPNRFVHKFPEHWDSIERPVGGGGPNCALITAYVFSDGENPQFQYVTHCPTHDVPLMNKRAKGKHLGNDQQPELKRTN
jgi:hypothetical protein